MLYQALQDWDYDGFVIADDTGELSVMPKHAMSDFSKA